jgi:hypothetical protein
LTGEELTGIISTHTSAARFVLQRGPKSSYREASIRTLIVSIIGVAAFTAGLVLFRQQRQVGAPVLKQVPAGENHPGTISLERLRESGY